MTAGGHVLTVGSASSHGDYPNPNSIDSGFAPTADGGGYFVMGADGQVFLAGDAATDFFGDPFTAYTTDGTAMLAVTVADRGISPVSITEIPQLIGAGFGWCEG